MGVVNTVATFIAIFMLQYFGRRTLLLWGQVNMGVCHALIGVFLMLNEDAVMKVFALLFVAAFEFSSGPIMWLYLAEVMPGAGLSIAAFVNWGVLLLISLATPVMVQDWPGVKWTFWFYAICCFLGLIFVAVFIEETKGKSEEEIKLMFRSKRALRESGFNVNNTPHHTLKEAT